MPRSIRIFTLIVSGTVVLSACQLSHSSDQSAEFVVELEDAFLSVGEYDFVTEEYPFYSGGKAVHLDSRTPPGGSGTLEIEIGQFVPAGIYDLTLSYADESDGHSPVRLSLGKSKFEFEMNENTSSAFPVEDIMRDITFSSVDISASSTLRITGEANRYQSEHKELVRLDKITLSKVIK